MGKEQERKKKNIARLTTHKMQKYSVQEQKQWQQQSRRQLWRQSGQFPGWLAR